MSNPDSILLDTHIWLWFVGGDSTLQPKIRKLINNAADESRLFLSAISIWEIAMLETKGRIRLEKVSRDWVTEALTKTKMHLSPLSPAIAIESCHLPGEFHGDPADRIIMATARVEGFTLVTRDARIVEYSKKDLIKVIKS